MGHKRWKGRDPRRRRAHKMQEQFLLPSFPVLAIVESGVPGESEEMSLVPWRGWGRGERRLLHSFCAYAADSLSPVSPPNSKSSSFGVLRWDHGNRTGLEGLHFNFSLSCIGGGNGNLLQCSCLENPRDGGAWWAAVYGVAQSQTRLMRLSSSSSSSSRREESWVPIQLCSWAMS